MVYFYLSKGVEFVMKKIAFLLFLTSILFGISACSLSREAKDNLKKNCSLAEDYYENKYDCNISITKSEYDFYSSVFTTYQKNRMLFKTDEDTIIFYDADADRFYDNKQAEEILLTLETKMLPKLYDMIPGNYKWNKEEFLECGYFYFYDSTKLVNMFHEYFEEDDWENFFMKEKPKIHFEETLYEISETMPNHEEMTTDVTDIITKYFTLSHLDIIYLTQELLGTITSTNHEGEDGFFASYCINDYKKYQRVQNYIKIADGIYITFTGDNFSFKENDILVLEETTLSNAIDIYKSAYKKAYDDDTADGSQRNYNPKTFSATQGFAYNIAASDSLKESARDYYKACIKVIPSELPETVTHFYYFATSENKFPQFEEFEITGEQTTMYFYLYMGDGYNTYICFGDSTKPDESLIDLSKKDFSNIILEETSP